MPPPGEAPPTRLSLILRLQDPEDLCAWQEFVEVYQPVIRSLARRRGLQPADAEDLSQEVLTRVARSIGDWNPDPKRGSFRGWLATITRNLTVQFFREGARRPTTGADSRIAEALDVACCGAEQVEEFDREHQRQLFLWAARKVQPRFQPKTWQAFWRTVVEGRKIPEVAEQLAVSKSQVYVARSRVMSLLKQTIEGTDFDASAGEGRDA